VERRGEADKVIDLRGMSCPWSILKAKSQLIAMDPGEVLEVLSADPMMFKDFLKVLGKRGHQLIQKIDKSEYSRLYVLRGNNEDKRINNSPVSNRYCC
jgi:tRNA 2-thiouridine synthesizing protein A